MIRAEKSFELLNNFEPPVLILSTNVGRGMFTLGDAVRERLPPAWVVHHHAIEEFLPDSAVREDVKRYRFIITHAPFLLYLMYKIPFFYYRKALRERWQPTDLGKLQTAIEATRARTIICISHRPAFWTTLLKSRTRLPVSVWGLLGEYGRSLGWKYVEWQMIEGFFSPLDKESLRLPIPDRVDFVEIELPARRAYYELAEQPADLKRVLVIGGYWGTGPLGKVIRELVNALPDLRVSVICGDNEALRRNLAGKLAQEKDIEVLGTVDSIAPWLRQCASVITKPGISTLLEAHAAQRQIFLLDGAPVAEEHNAEYARRNWGALSYSLATFRQWLDSQRAI